MHDQPKPKTYDTTAMKALDERATAMDMTPRELDMFVSYLCGSAPEAVEMALDYVQRRRDLDAPQVEAGVGDE